MAVWVRHSGLRRAAKSGDIVDIKPVLEPLSLCNIQSRLLMEPYPKSEDITSVLNEARDLLAVRRERDLASSIALLVTNGRSSSRGTRADTTASSSTGPREGYVVKRV
jgi:hypothetical protein